MVPDLKNVFILIPLHIFYELDIQKPWSIPKVDSWTSSAPKVQDKELGLSKPQNRSTSQSLGRCDGSPTCSDFEVPNSPAWGITELGVCKAVPTRP